MLSRRARASRSSRPAGSSAGTASQVPFVSLEPGHPPGASAFMAPTPKQPKPPPFGDNLGGGVLRRPGPPPAHVPSPKPSPGGIEDQGGSSRGGLGGPRYGAAPTGGVVGEPEG